MAVPRRLRLIDGPHFEFARSCYDLHSSHYRPLSPPENILKACTPSLCCVTIQARAWHDRYVTSSRLVNVTSSGGHASHLVTVTGHGGSGRSSDGHQLTPSRCVPGQGSHQLTPGMTGTPAAQAVALRTWWRSPAMVAAVAAAMATSSRLV